LVYNAQNTNNKDDKLHMGPFVTAIVQTIILLIQNPLICSWLRNHRYNSRAGRFRRTRPLVYIGWNRIPIITTVFKTIINYFYFLFQVSEVKWISVWCRKFAVDFAHLIFPEGLRVITASMRVKITLMLSQNTR
jgi:hypothetical protein